MIIEFHNEAREIDGPFRIYGTRAEFIALSDQLKDGKVDPGWIEVDPSVSDFKVKTTPQNPVIASWVAVSK